MIQEKTHKKVVLPNSTKKSIKNQNPEKNRKTIKIHKRKQNSYRGRGVQNRRKNLITVLLVNLRGYKSKANSLKKIVKQIRPSAVAMNETLLSGNMNVSLPPYTCWSKTDQKRGEGGLLRRCPNSLNTLQSGPGRGRKKMST